MSPASGRYPSGPELLAMLEVFATVDTVFREWGAFGQTQNPSLGRIYRSWQKACRILEVEVPEPALELGADSPAVNGGQCGSERAFGAQEEAT